MCVSYICLLHLSSVRYFCVRGRYGGDTHVFHEFNVAIIQILKYLLNKNWKGKTVYNKVLRGKDGLAKSFHFSTYSNRVSAKSGESFPLLFC